MLFWSPPMNLPLTRLPFFSFKESATAADTIRHITKTNPNFRTRFILFVLYVLGPFLRIANSIADSFLFRRQFDGIGLFRLLNKQVVSELGTTEITVKTQRDRIMRKPHAEPLADLARMADKLKLPTKK